MTKKVFIKGLGYVYGANAFHKGIKCVPAMDRKFLEEVITGQKDQSITIKYMKEWIKGWTEANLKAEC